LSLIKDFHQKSKSEILDWLEKYVNLNTYEISVPALRDASMALEGQTGLMVSCLFDYQVIKNVEQAGWYEEFKQILEDRVVDILSNSIYKDLKEDIIFKFRGHRPKASREEIPPGNTTIMTRFFTVLRAQFSSTSAPSGTQLSSMKLLTEEMKPIITDLKKLDMTIKGFEKELEKINAPWTSGRIIDFK